MNRAALHAISTTAGKVVLVIGVVIVQFVVALLAASDPAKAVQLLGLVVAGACFLIFPRVLLVAALVATIYPRRVGGGGLDLSLTDAVGVIALVAAFRYVPWRNTRIRLVLGALVIYLGFLLITVIPHHAPRAVFELGHRGVLFGGCILIGAALVASGTTRSALRWFTVACAGLALVAVNESIRSGFEPSYPLGTHKNAAGVVFAVAFLVLLLSSRYLHWPLWWINTLRIVILVGLAATQSRASAVGLIAALAARPVFMGSRGTARRGAVLILVTCIALGTVSLFSFNETELSRTSEQEQFGSVETRLDAIDLTINQVWKRNPLVGGGLKFWNDPAYPPLIPHNVVIGELGEAGLIGVAGMVMLITVTIVALRRGRGDLAVLGFCALVVRVIQGFADIFWVVGPLSVVVILIGMGLADDPEPPDDANDPPSLRRTLTAR